jgi:hypothetical protein
MTAQMIVAKPEVIKTSVGLSFILKKRFKMVEDKTGGRIKEMDYQNFKQNFDEFSKMIPNGRGALVITGYNGNDSMVIDVVRTVVGLRQKFKTGLVTRDQMILSRYKWYKKLLYTNVYDSIKVQMAS